MADSAVLYVRIFLGAVFLMSGLTKAVAPTQFARDLRGYRLLPAPASNVLAWLLPYLELTTALMLLFGFRIEWAALAAIGMLASFMIAIGTAMVRRLNLTCSCFGLLYREQVGWSTQARDAVLLGLALFVLRRHEIAPSVIDLVAGMNRFSNAVGLVLTVFALGFGLVVVALSVRTNRRRKIHA